VSAPAHAAEKLAIAIDAREMRERPWLPTTARFGAVLVGPDGEVVRVERDGGIEPLFPRRRSSIAQNPCSGPRGCAPEDLPDARGA
jgi:hypothetical protein